MEKIEKSTAGGDSDQPWKSYHTVFTNAKAGMEGVDKEKVQRIVFEMSKGSKYFENEERKKAYMKQRIDDMRAQREKLTGSDIAHYQKIADKRIVELEATRDLSRIWLHVDMDAFYAAVETLCDPSLKGKPMAVGSLSMISTANYEARKFGVRAAMPGFIARKLCPQLIFVPVDFKKYNHYSDLTRKVFQKYDPNFLAASLDEAYLDITNFCCDSGMTGGQVAEELRDSVHKETGLTCSAGVAPNRLLAKVCSDINKPNGQFILPNERMAVMAFIASLPIRKIGGIGKVTENILKDVFGITTCEDMLQNSSLICALFSWTSADFFLSACLGIGRTDKPQATLRKSMSNERTFASTEDEASLCQKLVDLAENLSAELSKGGLCGRTLTLKLKTSHFEVRTRAVTLPSYISSSEDILKHAMKLLKAELPGSFRLMGLRISHFREGSKGVPIDPKQKTLSSFIVNEKYTGARCVDEAHTASHVNEDDLSMDEKCSLSTDTRGTCEFIDLADAYGMEDFNFSDSLHGKAETEENSGPQLKCLKLKNDVDDHDNVRGASNMFINTAAQLMESNSSSLWVGEETSLDRLRPSISITHDEAALSSNPEEPVFWLDNYRCSVCGIEIPSSFSEERQEHFDFHLAEMLQEEESGAIHRIHKPQQSHIQKEERSQHRQRKKRKMSPSGSKHIPIDVFFAKTSQNS